MTDRHSRSAALWMVPILALYAWHIDLFWFVCEDAYISFRYSANLASGDGLRFNQNNFVPVEGYSNFLWVLLAAGFGFVGLDMLWWMPLLSALSGAVLLGLVFYASITRYGIRPLVAAWSTASLAVMAPYAVWATSGLATMPHALLMFATYLALASATTRRGGLVAGALALLLCFMRVEGIAWACVLPAVVAVEQRLAGGIKREPLVAYGAVVLVGYAPYYLWRAWYFRTMFSATTSVKVHFGALTFLRGFKYVSMFFAVHVTPLLALVGMGLTVTRERWRGAAGMAAIGFGVLLYAALVGGDYMPFFRFTVAAMPFLAVMIAIVFEELSDRLGPTAMSVAAVAALALGLLPSFGMHLAPKDLRAVFDVRERTSFEDFGDDLSNLVRGKPVSINVSELERYKSMSRYPVRMKDMAIAARPFVERGDTMPRGSIGVYGYYLRKADLWDVNGLVTPSVLKRAKHVPGGHPGHDQKINITQFYKKRPTIYDVRVFARDATAGKLRSWWKDVSEVDRQELYAPVFNRGKDGRYVTLMRLQDDEAARKQALKAWERTLQGMKEGT